MKRASTVAFLLVASLAAQGEPKSVEVRRADFSVHLKSEGVFRARRTTRVSSLVSGRSGRSWRAREIGCGVGTFSCAWSRIRSRPRSGSVRRSQRPRGWRQTGSGQAAADRGASQGRHGHGGGVRSGPAPPWSRRRRVRAGRGVAPRLPGSAWTRPGFSRRSTAW